MCVHRMGEWISLLAYDSILGRVCAAEVSTRGESVKDHFNSALFWTMVRVTLSLYVRRTTTLQLAGWAHNILVGTQLTWFDEIHGEMFVSFILEFRYPGCQQYLPDVSVRLTHWLAPRGLMDFLSTLALRWEIFFLYWTCSDLGGQKIEATEVCWTCDELKRRN